jgi:hypothetical protein
VFFRAPDDHAFAVELRVNRVDLRRVRHQGIALGAVRDHGPAQVTQLRLGFFLVGAVRLVVDRARASGLQLTSDGGLLQQLTKRVLESALEGEITDHIGYEKHDPAGVGSGNSRNGSPG